MSTDEVPFDLVAREEVRIDRTQLERYVTCPFMGKAVESGLVRDGSLAALSGSEAHDAYGAMAHAFSLGATDAREIAEIGLATARSANPLVQPDVLDAVKPSLGKFAGQLLYREDGQKRNPDDMLRYQGGKDDKSGQLTARIESGTTGPVYLLTSEVDLLMAGWNDRHLEETDWKSGRTRWNASDVRSSFQFRFHAFLLFENYPTLESASIRVWMTRLGYATDWAQFRRAELPDLRGLVMRGLVERETALAADVPACNPFAEQCVNCPVTGRYTANKVALCPAIASECEDCASDPQAFLAEYAAKQADLDRRKKLMYAYAKAHGPIEAAGLICGIKPPGDGRLGIYSRKAGRDDE